jgi:hypothetical protein
MLQLLIARRIVQCPFDSDQQNCLGVFSWLGAAQIDGTNRPRTCPLAGASIKVGSWPNAGVRTTEEPSFAPAVLPADGNRYIARVRCVTLSPFPSVCAIRPLPISRAAGSRTVASVSVSILGRPHVLWVRVLHAQACARASLSLVAQC